MASGVIRLPALTVWQPWCSLIVAGAKPWEFRGWAAPKAYRGRRIALHAGARPPRMSELAFLRAQLATGEPTGLKADIALPLVDAWIADISLLPTSSILGTAVLGEPIRSYELPEFAGEFANDSDRDEHANWAWPLTDIESLMPPAPMRGAQGFWTCEIEDLGHG